MRTRCRPPCLASFIVLAAALAFHFPFPVALADGSARALRRASGTYQGRWIRPIVFLTVDGREIRTSESLPLRLRLPSRQGRTVSRVDMAPIRNDSPRFVDLIGRFGRPRIRRNGNLVTYRARAVWLIGTAGLDETDFSGRLSLRVRNPGPRARIRQGRLIVRGDGAGWDGMIRARK